ncbi:hypothetical protein C8J57DRAFT_1593717, partial [Mycena rebaudengoi]
YTETGILPIRYRRIVLALRYAKYLVGITDQRDLARAVVKESLSLARLGHSCWLSDLRWVLGSLPVPVFVDFSAFDTTEGIDGIIDDVVAACNTALQTEIGELVKTHLLKTRLEYNDDGILETLRFRHYLRIVNTRHRLAYTRLLLSDHNLAVEELRHGNRIWRHVEHELRLCRFCSAGVEDEAHALLVCSARPVLTQLRARFLRDLFAARPALRSAARRLSAYDFLLTFLHDRDIISRVAKFVYDVLMLYEQTEMWIPPSHFRGLG